MGPERVVLFVRILLGKMMKDSSVILHQNLPLFNYFFHFQSHNRRVF